MGHFLYREVTTCECAGLRTSLIVQGFGRNGRAVPVVTGLVETAAGGLQLALRVGESGETVIVPLQVANQLVVNLREAMRERLKITGERLGVEEP